MGLSNYLVFDRGFIASKELKDKVVDTRVILEPESRGFTVNNPNKIDSVFNFELEEVFNNHLKDDKLLTALEVKAIVLRNFYYFCSVKNNVTNERKLTIRNDREFINFIDLQMNSPFLSKMHIEFLKSFFTIAIGNKPIVGLHSFLPLLKQSQRATKDDINNFYKWLDNLSKRNYGLLSRYDLCIKFSTMKSGLSTLLYALWIMFGRDKEYEMTGKTNENSLYLSY